MAKKRIDELLVEQGLADTRSRAKALVLAGKVRLGTERLDKPGRTLPAEAVLTVEQPPRFVSRGGDKIMINLIKICDTIVSRPLFRHRFFCCYELQHF